MINRDCKLSITRQAKLLGFSRGMVIDWATRKVLAHKVAITLEACHAFDVLNEAFAKYDAPQIVNTNQGSQFTAHDFVQTVKDKGLSNQHRRTRCMARQCHGRAALAFSQV